MNLTQLHNYKFRCRVKFCLIPILILYVLIGNAQGLCDKTGVEKGKFDFKNTNFTTICNIPYSLEIEDISGGTDIKYIFDYQGETDITKLKGQTSGSYNYNQQGTYTILQYGKKNGQEMYACEKFEVWESKKPVIDYYICDSKTIGITIENGSENKFDDFFVLWGDANENITGVIDTKLELKHVFTSIQPNQNITIYAYRKRKSLLNYEAYAAGCTQIVSLSVDMNESLPKPKIAELRANIDNSVEITIEHSLQTASYEINKQLATSEQVVGTTNTKEIKLSNVDLSTPNCYKVSYEAMACNTKIFSDEAVCSVPIQIQKRTDENQITFSTSWFPLTVIRQDIGGSNIKNITAISSTYTDEIKCNINYCYSGLIEKNNTKIYTEKKCTSRVLIPAPPLELCLVSVKEKNKIEIRSMDNPIQKEYQFSKQNENGVFDVIETSANNSFIDLQVKTSEKNYCYQVSYKDNCDAQSIPSAIFCSVLLKNNANVLEWSPQKPFTSNILSYELDKLDKNGSILETKILSSSQQNYKLPDGDNDYFYQVIVKSNNSLISESNLVNIIASNSIFMPSAFTPNNDGKNDNLVIFGNNIKTFLLIIYNKWGELVFESDDINKLWNGGWRNDLSNPLPNGQYPVSIKVTFLNGDKIEKKEVMTLLK